MVPLFISSDTGTPANPPTYFYIENELRQYLFLDKSPFQLQWRMIQLRKENVFPANEQEANYPLIGNQMPRSYQAEISAQRFSRNPKDSHAHRLYESPKIITRLMQNPQKLTFKTDCAEIYAGQVVFVLQARKIEDFQSQLFTTLQQFSTEKIDDTLTRFHAPFLIEDCAPEKNQIQLKDPYTLVPPKFPVKGILCQHERAFDLEAFLNFQMNQDSIWRCPICTKSVSHLVYLPTIQIIGEAIKKKEGNLLSFSLLQNGLFEIELVQQNPRNLDYDEQQSSGEKSQTNFFYYDIQTQQFVLTQEYYSDEQEEQDNLLIELPQRMEGNLSIENSKTEESFNEPSIEEVKEETKKKSKPESKSLLSHLKQLKRSKLLSKKQRKLLRIKKLIQSKFPICHKRIPRKPIKQIQEKLGGIEEITHKKNEVAQLTQRMIMDLLIRGIPGKESKLMEECEELAEDVGEIAVKIQAQHKHSF